MLLVSKIFNSSRNISKHLLQLQLCKSTRLDAMLTSMYYKKYTKNNQNLTKSPEQNRN